MSKKIKIPPEIELFSCVPCLITDFEGVILKAGRKALLLLSQEEEIEGRNIKSLLPGESVKQWEEALGGLKDSQKAQFILLEFPDPLENKRHVGVTIENWQLEGKSVLLHSFFDLSSRVDQERKRLKTEKDFLFAVSHEFKTPIMVMGAIQESLRMIPPMERQRLFLEYWNIWERNLRRLKRLVDNLLDSQRDNLQNKLLLEKERISKILFEALEDQKILADSRKVKIITEIKEIPSFLFDSDAISRMMENIINNAVKFSPKEGIVKISLFEDSGEAVFLVEDQGPGISPEDMEKLFSPFSPASRPQKGIKGTGLGLYVSRIIAEGHGGSLFIESNPGEGTKVKIKIPIKTELN